MSGERALPGQASLRYLKVEAKRRRAAGEFATLHLAQLAIAREHGQVSWTALRAAIDAAETAAGHEGHALANRQIYIEHVTHSALRVLEGEAGG